jgi:hypothetical protein
MARGRGFIGSEDLFEEARREPDRLLRPLVLRAARVLGTTRRTPLVVSANWTWPSGTSVEGDEDDAVTSGVNRLSRCARRSDDTNGTSLGANHYGYWTCEYSFSCSLGLILGVSTRCPIFPVLSMNNNLQTL